MGIQRQFTARERAELAEHMRKEHWQRHMNNKTYEQWLSEQDQAEIDRVHKMMDAIERSLGL